MDKTYTDTYKILGFTGGNWDYAINANESCGVPCSVMSEDLIPEGERRLGVYFLGWESIEVCQQSPCNTRRKVYSLLLIVTSGRH